jgi:Ca2+-binding EF-hand superfamily protein
LIQVCVNDAILDEDEIVNEAEINDFIKSENEKVVTFNRFKKLMNIVDENKSDIQIKYIFKILDSDDNGLISNLNSKFIKHFNQMMNVFS